MFSQVGMTPTTLTGAFMPAARGSREHAAGTGHVELHSSISPAGRGDAAGVEGDALADQRQRLHLFAAPL
jgi:hypothetical protein